jgi:hypothetical protein
MMRRLGTTQKERFGKRKDNLHTQIFKGRMEGAINTCSRKP